MTKNLERSQHVNGNQSMFLQQGSDSDKDTKDHPEQHKEAREHRDHKDHKESKDSKDDDGHIISTSPPKQFGDGKKELEFWTIFQLREKLIEDYSCALQNTQKLLVHGRLYISENTLCFYSSLFGITTKIISLMEISDIQKKNTVILFPNAIEITMKNEQKHFFSSFLFRDQAFTSLMNVWEARKKIGIHAQLDVRPRRDSTSSLSSESTEGSDEIEEIQSEDEEEEEEGGEEVEVIEEDKKSVSNEGDEDLLEAAVAQFQYGLEEFKQKPKEDTTATEHFTKKMRNSSDLEAIPSRKETNALKAAEEVLVESQSGIVPPLNPNCEDEQLHDCTEPPLLEEQLPLTTKEFFNKFLRDESPFWMDVNKLADYTDIEVTPWVLSEHRCCIVRKMNFVSPVSAKLGPKTAAVNSEHHCRFQDPHHLVLEIISTSKGVPYGESFNVIYRFDWKDDPQSSGCHLKIVSTVKFTKSVWGVKGLITSTAHSDCMEFSRKWISLLKKRNKVPSTGKKRSTSRKKVNVEGRPKELAAVGNAVAAPPPQVDLFSYARTYANDHPKHVAIAIVVALFILFTIIHLFCRVSSLEGQLWEADARQSALEIQVKTLQTAFHDLSSNAVGMDPSVKKALLTKLATLRDQVMEAEEQLKEGSFHSEL